MQTPSPHLNTVTSEAIITAKKKYLLCKKNIVKNAIYHGTLPCLYMLNWKKQYTPAPKYMHIHILLQECLYTLTPMHACIYKCAIVYTCTCTIFFLYINYITYLEEMSCCWLEAKRGKRARWEHLKRFIVIFLASRVKARTNN